MTQEPEPIRGEPEPRGAGEFANPETGFDPGITLAATQPALISGFEAWYRSRMEALRLESEGFLLLSETPVLRVAGSPGWLGDAEGRSPRRTARESRRETLGAAEGMSDATGVGLRGVVFSAARS